MAHKVIITCAITGSIRTPSMSPHLPLTLDQIVTSAIEAAEAGAAILHLHAREPENGRPSGDPDLFLKQARSTDNDDNGASTRGCAGAFVPDGR